MPAFTKTVFGFVFFLAVIFVNGCSRDNPLTQPGPFVPVVVPDCEELTPSYQFFTDIKLKNYLSQDFDATLLPGFDSTNFDYEAEVDYLYDSIRIRPLRLSNNDVMELQPNGVWQRMADLNNREVFNQEVRINGDEIIYGATSANIALKEEFTTITINVSANISVPAADICGAAQSPGTGDEDESADIAKQILNISYDYKVVVRRTPLNEIVINEIEVTSPDAEDQFGRAVAVGDFTNEFNRDIRVLAVGAFQDDGVDNTKIDSGGVYVYEQASKGDWNEVALLRASNAEAGDLFGYSVSVFNNFIAVSAPGEDSLSSGVFPYVDVSGAFDMDGSPIGDGENDNAPFEISNLAESSGAVYLFKREEAVDGGWMQVAYIKPPINVIGVDGYNDAFGSKVLLQDDVLLVSAPKEDSFSATGSDTNSPNSGAVYAYRYNAVNDSWRYGTKIKARAPGTGDAFGTSISMQGNRLAVGAPGEDSDIKTVINGGSLESNDPRMNNNAIDSGAVYVFQKGLNQWSFETYVKASNADAGDSFGSAVSLSADSLAVGANHEDSNGFGLNRNKHDNTSVDSGAVYVFDFITQWVESAYVKQSENLPMSGFGSSIQLENNTLLVGAPVFNNSEGAVYAFSKIDDQWSQDRKYSQADTNELQNGARFGQSISLFQSVFSIGANGFLNQASGTALDNAGKAYIYQ